MRAYIYDAIRTDNELHRIGLASEGVFAGDVDTPEIRPFIQLMWGINQAVPSIGGMGPRQLTIWVHDEPNDYARIDAIIRRIKAIFAQVIAAKHEFGYISVIEWNGDSEDGKDDGHGTIFRTTGHSIVGTGA